MKDSDSGRWTIELSLSHHDNGYYSVDWFKGENETIERASNAKSEEEADAILREAYKGPDVDGVICKWFILRNLHHPEFWRFGGHNWERATRRPRFAATLAQSVPEAKQTVRGADAEDRRWVAPPGPWLLLARSRQRRTNPHKAAFVPCRPYPVICAGGRQGYGKSRSCPAFAQICDVE